MIYLISITFAILFVFWYLNKKSKNNYFYNPKEDDYRLILNLYDNFGWDSYNFKKAWVHFSFFPNKYNGTSVINDRFMIKGLEPMSVEHDFDWIFAKSFKELHNSNIKYCKKLRDVNSNWFWVWGFIFCGLEIVSVFKSIKYIFPIFTTH
jgi:hypothetical protein